MRMNLITIISTAIAANTLSSVQLIKWLLQELVNSLNALAVIIKVWFGNSAKNITRTWKRLVQVLTCCRHCKTVTCTINYSTTQNCMHVYKVRRRHFKNAGICRQTNRIGSLGKHGLGWYRKRKEIAAEERRIVPSRRRRWVDLNSARSFFSCWSMVLFFRLACCSSSDRPPPQQSIFLVCLDW